MKASSQRGMSTVNLDKYSLSLLTAKEDILNGKNSTNWALFVYDRGNDLKLADSGAGGIEELAQKFNSNSIKYGFCRVTDPSSGLPRYILINWVGQDVDDARRQLCSGHIPAIQSFFKEAHVLVPARRPDDVTLNAIHRLISKIQPSSRRFGRSASVTGSEDTVGTKYMRTNAAMEMRKLSRERFWALAEKEEEERKAEEKMRKTVEKKRLERERLEKEKREADEREKRITEKERMVEEQRRLQAIFEAEERKKEKIKWEQQQKEHEEETRNRYKRSESIEKAAEAKALLSHRPMNPREFFKQRERESSSSSPPASPLGKAGSQRRPPLRYTRSNTDSCFSFTKSESPTSPTGSWRSGCTFPSPRSTGPSFSPTEMFRTGSSFKLSSSTSRGDYVFSAISSASQPGRNSPRQGYLGSPPTLRSSSDISPTAEPVSVNHVRYDSQPTAESVTYINLNATKDVPHDSTAVAESESPKNSYSINSTSHYNVSTEDIVPNETAELVTYSTVATKNAVYPEDSTAQSVSHDNAVTVVESVSYTSPVTSLPPENPLAEKHILLVNQPVKESIVCISTSSSKQQEEYDYPVVAKYVSLDDSPTLESAPCSTTSTTEFVFQFSTPRTGHTSDENKLASKSSSNEVQTEDGLDSQKKHPEAEAIPFDKQTAEESVSYGNPPNTALASVDKQPCSYLQPTENQLNEEVALIAEHSAGAVVPSEEQPTANLDPSENQSKAVSEPFETNLRTELAYASNLQREELVSFEDQQEEMAEVSEDHLRKQLFFSEKQAETELELTQNYTSTECLPSKNHPNTELVYYENQAKTELVSSEKQTSTELSYEDKWRAEIVYPENHSFTEMEPHENQAATALEPCRHMKESELEPYKKQSTASLESYENQPKIEAVCYEKQTVTELISSEIEPVPSENLSREELEPCEDQVTEEMVCSENQTVVEWEPRKDQIRADLAPSESQLNAEVVYFENRPAAEFVFSEDQLCTGKVPFEDQIRTELIFSDSKSTVKLEPSEDHVRAEVIPCEDQNIEELVYHESHSKVEVEHSEDLLRTELLPFEDQIRAELVYCENETPGEMELSEDQVRAEVTPSEDQIRAELVYYENESAEELEPSEKQLREEFVPCEDEIRAELVYQENQSSAKLEPSEDQYRAELLPWVNQPTVQLDLYKNQETSTVEPCEGKLVGKYEPSENQQEVLIVTCETQSRTDLVYCENQPSKEQLPFEKKSSAEILTSEKEYMPFESSTAAMPVENHVTVEQVLYDSPPTTEYLSCETTPSEKSFCLVSCVTTYPVVCGPSAELSDVYANPVAEDSVPFGVSSEAETAPLDEQPIPAAEHKANCNGDQGAERYMTIDETATLDSVSSNTLLALSNLSLTSPSTTELTDYQPIADYVSVDNAASVNVSLSCNSPQAEADFYSDILTADNTLASQTAESFSITTAQDMLLQSDEDRCRISNLSDSHSVAFKLNENGNEILSDTVVSEHAVPAAQCQTARVEVFMYDQNDAVAQEIEEHAEKQYSSKDTVISEHAVPGAQCQTTQVEVVLYDQNDAQETEEHVEKQYNSKEDNTVTPECTMPAMWCHIPELEAFLRDQPSIVPYMIEEQSEEQYCSEDELKPEDEQTHAQYSLLSFNALEKDKACTTSKIQYCGSEDHDSGMEQDQQTEDDTQQDTRTSNPNLYEQEICGYQTENGVDTSFEPDTLSKTVKTDESTS